MSRSEPVDLSNCDREPIHVPGSIQPHGILLVLDSRGIIAQVAGDVACVLGTEPRALLGREASQFLPPGVLSGLSQLGGREPRFLGSMDAAGAPGLFLDVLAHSRGEALLLELEQRAAPPQSATQVLSEVRKFAAELEAAADMPRLFQAAATAMRRLTGFDRVMIYRFLGDGAGAVVAEDKRQSLATFLNHHYPASDIPRQARALYLQNLIRVIPDTDYTPEPLIASGRPEPLDMTDCVLRSVSPIHIQYLKNMGVAASMSVSIVVNGDLWGLIACHHGAPKMIPYETREICKHLGQILSAQIDAREDLAHHAEMQALAAIREALTERLARSAVVDEALMVSDMRDIVPSQGAAIVRGDRVIASGVTPTEAQLKELAEWIAPAIDVAPYATRQLSAEYPPASAFASQASGLLAAATHGDEPLILMWFRKELVETIEWAGNPEKPVENEDGAGILTPRKSFASWKATVRNQSRAWSAAEVDAARRFASDLYELRAGQTLRELNIQLRRALGEREALLKQKDLLMQEVNHRVQNSLQLVNSMLGLQARQAADENVKAHFDEAVRRIIAVSGVHRRLWKSDGIQNVEFGAYLADLRDDLVSAWGPPWDGHVRVKAQSVLVPTDRAVKLALIVTELMTNAVKYAYGGSPGPIAVSLKEEGRALRIVVSDNGVGMRAEASKSGLGYRLVRAFIGELGGEVQIASDESGTRTTIEAPIAQPRPAT